MIAHDDNNSVVERLCECIEQLSSREGGLKVFAQRLRGIYHRVQFREVHEWSVATERLIRVHEGYARWILVQVPINTSG
jgi:hypothetical protein